VSPAAPPPAGPSATPAPEPDLDWPDAPDDLPVRDDDGAGWAGEPVVSPGELGRVPAASSIRKFTTDAGRARAGAGVGSLLGDVYYAVISFAIAAGVALGIAQQLRVALPPAPDVSAPSRLSLPTLVVVALLGMAGALLGLAGRLGPVSAGGAEATWWLDLPVDRRRLLRPAARRAPLVAAVLGAVVVALLDGGLLADEGGRTARAAAVGALVAVALVLAATVAQTLGLGRRPIALSGDLLLFAAPFVAVALTAAGTAWDVVPVPSWPVLAAGLLVVAGLAVLVDRRLGDVPARTLRESGSVVGQAVGAVVSMDSRELGRALSAGIAAPRRRWVSRLRGVRGPVTALVGADLVLLRRSPRHLAQLVVAAVLPVLVTVVPELAAPGWVLIALLVGGYLAATATGEGARYAEMAPILDRLLPISAKDTRRLRMVAPGIVMLVWSVPVLAAIGRWAGSVAPWIELGVVAAPVWAAATVRAAYRPSPDWSKPLVSTPAGALPSGVAAVVSRGPDVVVLGLVPTWIAILVEHVTPTMLVAQVLCSLVAVLVSSSIAEGTFMDRMTKMSEEAQAEREAMRKRT
jgi:hypothetical protein